MKPLVLWVELLYMISVFVLIAYLTLSNMIPRASDPTTRRGRFFTGVAGLFCAVTGIILLAGINWSFASQVRTIMYFFLASIDLFLTGIMVTYLAIFRQHFGRKIQVNKGETPPPGPCSEK